MELYGAIIATISFVIPAIFFMFIIYTVFEKFKENKKAMKSLIMIRVSALAIITVSVFSVLQNTFLKEQTTLNFKALMWFIILVPIMKKKKLHPIIYMLISGIIGIIFKF